MKQQTMGLKTREFLRSNHKQIVHAWNYRLKEYPPFQDPIKFSTIQKEQEKGKDLFSTVLELDPGPGKDLQEGTWSIVNRIHSPAYSVCDFAIEAFCLEDAVCHALMNTHFPPEQLFAANQEIRRTVFTLSQTILERSAGIYEYAVENGKRAFCYFDCHGDIRYSNEAMLSLTKTTGQVSKTNITQFFAPADKTLIEEMLRDTLGRKTIFRSLNFKDGQGRVLPVGAEISPIIIQGKPVGGYAGLVDLSRVMQGQEKVYDKSALGIIKVNTNYEFTYANPAAQDILGEKNLEGKSIKHLFPKKNPGKP
jgi:PAS domain S-box-containing protein